MFTNGAEGPQPVLVADGYRLGWGRRGQMPSYFLVLEGKIVVRIRDDDVLIAEAWFDQAMKPVPRLETLKVAPLGGRAYPVKMRMNVPYKPGHWTGITTTGGRFDLEPPGYLVTLSNLRSPRPRSAP